MTEHVISDQAGSGAGAVPDIGTLAWEVPEIAAVAVLVAFFVIVIGALATGIDVSTTMQPPFIDPMESIWSAIQFGTTWAEPLLAIILLGVLGLCWWQVEAWSDEVHEDDAEHSTALGHVRRAERTSLWALGSLIVTAVGAVAALVALIGFNVPTHPGQLVWSRAIGAGAGVVAVVVVAGAGALMFKRMRVRDPSGDTSSEEQPSYG